MGKSREWIEKLKKAADEKLNKKPLDPKEERELKKAETRKMAERTIKAIDIAKKGAAQYEKVAKKVDEAAKGATEKAADLLEKAKPLADKVDDAANAVGNAASTAGKKVKGLFQRAAKKVEDAKKDNAKKPTTGSGILDLLTPAVPETEATKPKEPKDDAPKP